MILGERFYQMSNAIFRYDLTPATFMVYSYLVCCTDQKDVCWQSIGKIAVNCNCSENTARKAVTALVKKRFIRRVATYEDWIDGHSRQTNNTYYILDLPPVQSSAAPTPAKKYRQVENAAASQPPPCRGVCGFWLQHGALTRQTNEALRGPLFEAFPTSEGWENEKQDKQPTSQPASVDSHLPAVRAVSGGRK